MIAAWARAGKSGAGSVRTGRGDLQEKQQAIASGGFPKWFGFAQSRILSWRIAARRQRMNTEHGKSGSEDRQVVFSARDLSKIYRMGQVTIPTLRGVDLERHAGELVVMLGASGSGQSTLLNIMGGLIDGALPGLWGSGRLRLLCFGGRMSLSPPPHGEATPPCPG